MIRPIHCTDACVDLSLPFLSANNTGVVRDGTGRSTGRQTENSSFNRLTGLGVVF